MIAVIIPTYGRADRLARVAANIAENTETAHRVVFAVEVDDTASIDVAAELDVDVVVNERKANYSGAITTAYLATPAEHVFAGADDLNFHPGWDIPALALMDDWTMVVGTNDLLNPYVTAGLHATHYLVDRRYLDEVGGVVDQGPRFLPVRRVRPPVPRHRVHRHGEDAGQVPPVLRLRGRAHERLVAEG